MSLLFKELVVTEELHVPFRSFAPCNKSNLFNRDKFYIKYSLVGPKIGCWVVCLGDEQNIGKNKWLYLPVEKLYCCHSCGWELALAHRHMGCVTHSNRLFHGNIMFMYVYLGGVRKSHTLTYFLCLSPALLNSIVPLNLDFFTNHTCFLFDQVCTHTSPPSCAGGGTLIIPPFLAFLLYSPNCSYFSAPPPSLQLNF